MHIIASKAVCLKEAAEPGFVQYQQQVVNNARVLAEGLNRYGFRLVSGGTDNHLILMDVKAQGMTGKVAEKLLDEVNITVQQKYHSV